MQETVIDRKTRKAFFIAFRIYVKLTSSLLCKDIYILFIISNFSEVYLDAP